MEKKSNLFDVMNALDNNESDEYFLINFSESKAAIQNRIQEALAAIAPSMNRIAEGAKAAKNYKNDLTKSEYHGIEVESFLKRISPTAEIKQLCQYTGITPSAMSKYISGESDIPGSKLIRISNALEVSSDLILKQKSLTDNVRFVDDKIKLYKFNSATGDIMIENQEYNLTSELPILDNYTQIVRFPEPLKFLGLKENSILVISKDVNLLDKLERPRIACLYDWRKHQYFFAKIMRQKDRDGNYIDNNRFDYFDGVERRSCGKREMKEMFKFFVLKGFVDYQY